MAQRRDPLQKQIDQLKKISILQDLDDKDIQTLVEASKPMTFNKGDMIFKKGRTANQIYIILKGTVTEYAMDGNDFTVVIKDGGKGDCFGELAVLLEENYLTSVAALTDLKVLTITAETFSEVMWRSKKSIQAVLSDCIHRLQKSAQKSISYTMFNSEGRLAYILVMMHNENKEEGYIRATQETLSTKCGIARQTASTILNTWKKDGIIDIRRGKIYVHNADDLMQIAMQGAKSY